MNLQYVVSIEDKPYFWWQIRLLHHSMKLLDIDNDLLVCVAKEDEEKNYKFLNLFWHENQGKNINYLPYNKPYAISQALKCGALKQPFVLLDPDMFMLRKIPLVNNIISGSHCWYMTPIEIRKGGFDFNDFKIESEKYWYSIGLLYQFNGIDIDFFDEVCDILIELINIYNPNKKKLVNDGGYWVREMMAYAIAIARRKIPIKLFKNWHSYLNDKNNSLVVHYCNSYEEWDKKNFYSLDSKPFEEMLAISSQRYNVQCMQMIISSMLGKN